MDSCSHFQEKQVSLSLSLSLRERERDRDREKRERALKSLIVDKVEGQLVHGRKQCHKNVCFRKNGTLNIEINPHIKQRRLRPDHLSTVRI